MSPCSARRAAIGCLVALATALSAGPVGAQSKAKQTPTTKAATKTNQPATAAPPSSSGPPAPRSVHYTWVPPQIQGRASPFAVDVVLGTAGAGVLALLLIMSTWVPPARPKSDDPLDSIPGQHRNKLKLLAGSEAILWASAGSDRVRRRNAAVVALFGFSMFAVALSAAVHYNWDGAEIALAAVTGCAAPCAVILVLQPRYLFMLTDKRAYVLRLASDRRHKGFAYDAVDLAPVEVRRASLVAWAGTVFFPRARVVAKAKAQEAADLGIPAPDWGPCGFPAVDYPSHVGDLVRQVTEAAARPVLPPPPPPDVPQW